MDLFARMSTYVRVVEAGSISAAAKHLALSPAAASRQIAALEAELGTTLLRRSTRRMAITPAGKRYYERCLRILRDVDEAQAIAHGSDAEGLVKISAAVTFGLASVVPRIEALIAKHPNLRIDLRLEDRVTDLVLDGVDIAIRVGATFPQSTEIVAQRLTSFQRILVAAPSYLKRHGTPKTVSELGKHDVLSHVVDRVGDGWELVNGAERARVATRVTFSSNAGHVLHALALRGTGITMLPTWFVADDIARRALRIVLPGWHSEVTDVHALYRTAQRGEPRVRTVVEFLRAAYAEADGR